MFFGYSCYVWLGLRFWLYVIYWGVLYVFCLQFIVLSSFYFIVGLDFVWGGLEGGCGVQSSLFIVGSCLMGRGGYKDDNEDYWGFY